MIRITIEQEEEGTAVIIDGELTADDLPEVQRVRSALGGAVVLQLGGLTVCGDEGVRELRSWLADGARLRDADLFLRMVLDGEPKRSQ